MTRLELAQQKLARLEAKFTTRTQSAYSHMAQANGQPMNDKRGGRAFLNKVDQLENSVFNVMHEIEAQKERIGLLKEREHKKACHLTSNYGLETSVYNIEALKERKQTKATRDKIKLLEDIQAKAENDQLNMSDKAKQMIADGLVKQWDKKPIYYFVTGLRKVAFVVNNKTGEFILSKKYFPRTDEDKKAVNKLLGRGDA